MNTNKFNDDFFALVREAEIWKQLSGDSYFNWTESLIDRYQDKINWQFLSENSNVQWSASMLEKYKNKLDWRALSGNGSRGLFSSENLRKFSSRWDWAQLSSNSSVNWTKEKVEEFKERIDWGKLIDCYTDNLFSLEFFELYKDYFPVSLLQQSRLWDRVVEIYKERLVEEILAQ